MITIQINSLYTETAKLAEIPHYLAQAVQQAGEGQHITLTGPGPVWLYLAIAHALHSKALSLAYDSPASGRVVIFNHDPH